MLLVEDDRRNVFALGIQPSRKKGVKVQVAENGKRAIEFLQEQADFDLVFMDIMMPVMGGYEAMKDHSSRFGDGQFADYRADGQGDEGRTR